MLDKKSPANVVVGRQHGNSGSESVRRKACVLTLISLSSAGAIATADTLQLYVDKKTKQVYTEPAPGRIKLGTFEEVDKATSDSGQTIPQNKKVPANRLQMLEKKEETLEVRTEDLETRVQDLSVAEKAVEEKMDLISDNTSPELFSEKVLKGKWYERISLRGYTQFRYTDVLDGDMGLTFHPGDRSIGDNQSFFIRRGRLIFSGDVAEHLYLYIQPDLNALPADGDFSLQLRDAYADVSFDKKKEFRVRLGQSKVPFGFVNMQSSQNRLALERPDALNTAVESERDIGAFFYWAPDYVRERFKRLVKDGLKGSGDYGVVGVGLYSGQGLNRSDSNDGLHYVAHLSYPFELASGQMFEAGLHAYTGRFVPRTAEIEVDDEELTPKVASAGIPDERVAASFMWYPQPFGFEVEWTVGHGPQLSEDFTKIEQGFLHGGFAQATYRYHGDWGNIMPFVRWQYYDGGRKFASNAPKERVNEFDFGLEWAPWPEVEITAMYTYTPYRTNTRKAPYNALEDGQRLGLQVQWNY